MVGALELQSIRARIADRLTAVLSPIVLLVVGIEIPLVLAHGDAEQWPRLVPNLIALAVVPFVMLLRRRGRPLLAAGLLLGLGAVAIMIGMLVNGGLRAPISILGLVLVAAVCTLFGIRASVLSAVAVVAWFVGIWLAQSADLLPDRAPVSLGVFTVTTAGHAAIFIGIIVIPQRIMLEAMRETQERRAEATLARHRERDMELALRAVFDQTTHLIGLLDAEGHLLQANRAALEISGLQLSDIQGRHFADIGWWSEHDRERIRDGIRRAAAGENVHFQIRNVDARGRDLILDFSLVPFRDEEGEIRYLIPEGRDVTELIETQNRLHHAQKLEAIGHLAGGVAHDFNNVLAAILGSAQVLRIQINDRDPIERQLQMVDTIIAAGGRSAELIAQLLAFGRKQRLENRPLRLHGCIDSMLALLERTLPASIAIERDFCRDDPRIVGDPTAIESALLNLGINARDAMPDGGRMTIATRIVDLDAAWCAQSAFDIEPGPYVRCSIADTGSGLDPAIRDQIFEPFFTTKPEGKGTGLGLAAVFGTVVSHRGAVDVSSEPGRGATFTLSFPLLEQCPDDAIQPPATNGIGHRTQTDHDDSDMSVK